MRRIVMVVVVALVMAAMVLTMVAPAMAQRFCAQGFRPQLIEPTPGPAPNVFACVPIGPPS
jgi:hypothetical protein